MTKKAMRFLGFALAALMVVTGQVSADEGGSAASQQKIQNLESKVASLERIVTTLQNQGTSSGSVQPITPVEGGQGGFLRTVEDITMTGFVDTQFNQNLQSETTNVGNPGQANPLRIFDGNQNTFTINNVELDFEKQANPEGGAGFRADIAIGEDAQVVDTATNGADADEFSIQQAYVQLVAPLSFLADNEVLGDTVDIRVGRMVTLAGAEVIEGPYNWNISRSFNFGLGIPFTHTGIRAAYKLFNDRVTTYLGLNNGWDNVIDNNMYKTMESAFTVQVLENLTYTAAFYWGGEAAASSAQKRYLLTNVATWSATEKLSFMGEITFGTQRRVPGLEGFAFENAQWHGYAGYARYQFTDKFAMAARFELFKDDDLFRSPLAAKPGSGAQTLWSPTITAEYRFYNNLLGRLEFRHDKGDDRNAFNAESSQQTIGAQMIYLFA